jgi:hypothetical protein
MRKRLGDMNCRNSKRNVWLGGKPVRQGHHRQALKLTALTLMLLGGILFLGVVTGLAKEKKPLSKTVSGVVFDEAENVIQGATIELTDLQSRKVLDIYSQEGGHYQFTDLSFSHDYTIKATYHGLSSEVRQVSSMDMRTRPVMNLTLLKPNK